MSHTDSLALHRRRQAAHRLEPFQCGCRDLWSCHHEHTERRDDIDLDGWESTVQLLTGLGLTPALPAPVHAALHRRALRKRLLQLASS